jgi:hypothetical protein
MQKRDIFLVRFIFGDRGMKKKFDILRIVLTLFVENSFDIFYNFADSCFEDGLVDLSNEGLVCFV